MPKKTRYAKIAISIPEEDLAAADELASKSDRSRSWVISEAVRRYTAEPPRGSKSAAVRPGIGSLRRAQLAADLRLSPEERVRASEETARAGAVRARLRAERVIGFDRYEDYLAWKRREEIGG